MSKPTTGDFTKTAGWLTAVSSPVRRVTSSRR
jgi:hypothetical protein